MGFVIFPWHSTFLDWILFSHTSIYLYVDLAVPLKKKSLNLSYID